MSTSGACSYIKWEPWELAILVVRTGPVLSRQWFNVSPVDVSLITNSTTVRQSVSDSVILCHSTRLAASHVFLRRDLRYRMTTTAIMRHTDHLIEQAERYKRLLDVHTAQARIWPPVNRPKTLLDVIRCYWWSDPLSRFWLATVIANNNTASENPPLLLFLGKGFSVIQYVPGRNSVQFDQLQK